MPLQNRAAATIIKGMNRVSPLSILYGCLLAALLPASVQAQVYRCQQGEVTVFSDRPCEAGAKPEPLPQPVIVPAGPSADLLGEAEKAAQRSAERQADENAEWHEGYKTRKQQEEKLRNARVTGTVVEGMRPAEVRRIHGEPTVVSQGSNSKGPYETWSFVGSDGTRTHVTFSNGVVTAVRSRSSRK
jgi:hypothetical protein